MKFITLMALYSLLNILYWLLLFNGSTGQIRTDTEMILSHLSPAYWTTVPNINSLLPENLPLFQNIGTL